MHSVDVKPVAGAGRAANAPESGSEAVERAEALMPLLEANAETAEKLRRMPDDSIEAIDESGLMWMTAPRHYGGLEAPLKDVVRVSELFSQACGSASWCIALFTAMPYLLAKFDDQVQDEVYAGGNLFMCGAVTPSGKLTPTDGGYRLDGTWRFVTGNHPSAWTQLAAFVPGSDGAEHVAFAMVPREDWTPNDDWFVSGLAGTGSNSITIDDVFVPEYRVLHDSGFNSGISERLADNRYFGTPMIPYTASVTTGTPLGMAVAALANFERRVQKRPIAYLNYEHAADSTVTHLQMDEAVMKLDQARFHSMHAIELSEALRDAPEDMAMRARLKGDVGWCNRLSREVVDIVQKGSGASAVSLRDPLQRIVRNSQTMSLHGFIHGTTNAEIHGRARCGLEPNSVAV